MDEPKRYYQRFFPVWEGYEAGELLGSGSFGDVYVLIRKDSPEECFEAFKEVAVPPAHMDCMEEAVFQGLTLENARYFYEGMKDKAWEEVEILRKLADCPNILRVSDACIREFPEDSGEYGWVIFVRMERLVPFKDHLMKNGISLREAAQLACDLCTALEACRVQGILHRDIKPENLFYSPSEKRFKLGDFGLACYSERMTEQKGLPGTLTHMSPEVFRGAQFDYADDLYAVGMVLYKLLNENRIPFLPDYPVPYTMAMRNQALRRRMDQAEISLPSFVRKDSDGQCRMLTFGTVSPEGRMELARIAARSIATGRENRYSSPEELRQRLLEWDKKYK